MTSTFKALNLNSSLWKALEDIGLDKPTTIQEKAFPAIMGGEDICGIAQTGTGKTFAYLLPALRQWRFSKEPYPQILILVPTRELVIQVVKAVKQLTTYMNVVTIGVYGGVNMRPQMAAVENGCDVIIGTPGRLMDLALNGSLRMKNIKKLVIDEMDEMLNLGFRTQIRSILELLPPKRQNLLFSATITEDVSQLLDTYFPGIRYIEAARAGSPLENIEQSAYELPNFHTKVNLLRLLLQQNPHMSRVLIFTATKKMADQLFEALEPDFSGQLGVIHSNKAQNHRFNTVNAFEKGACPYLIATDIVARGIDIAAVSHVFNFDLPEQAEQYIHRIGRTGRADKKGIAISFITPADTAALQQIEALMDYQVPLQALPGDLELSALLTEDELPKRFVPNIQLKIPKKEEGGAAFHEKLPKNKKFNIKVRHADKMREKYGKPKTRGAKPSRKK